MILDAAIVFWIIGIVVGLVVCAKVPSPTGMKPRDFIFVALVLGWVFVVGELADVAHQRRRQCAVSPPDPLAALDSMLLSWADPEHPAYEPNPDVRTLIEDGWPVAQARDMVRVEGGDPDKGLCECDTCRRDREIRMPYKGAPLPQSVEDWHPSHGGMPQYACPCGRKWGQGTKGPVVCSQCGAEVWPHLIYREPPPALAGSNIGITATRQGMTERQVAAVEKVLLSERWPYAHHGDCVGGDAAFHAICERLGILVVIHPPTDDKLRAYCDGAAMVLPPLPYLTRNRAIVDSVALLLACPKELAEPAPARGQGTWSTVRYARKRGVPVLVLWP